MTDNTTIKPVTSPYHGHGITLRLLCAADLPDTLAWRNRDDARIWFKSSATLEWNQHAAWFQAYSGRTDDYHFIVDVDGQAVGQAAVYRIDREKKSAEIGRFLVAPEHVGKGYIDRACGALISLCKTQLGLDYLYLEVFEENQRAIRLYLHHGFERETTQGGLMRMGWRLNRCNHG